MKPYKQIFEIVKSIRAMLRSLSRLSRGYQ